MDPADEAFIAETQRRNANMAEDLLTQKQVASGEP
jgi:hypothetical protein